MKKKLIIGIISIGVLASIGIGSFELYTTNTQNSKLYNKVTQDTSIKNSSDIVQDTTTDKKANNTNINNNKGLNSTVKKDNTNIQNPNNVKLNSTIQKNDNKQNDNKYTSNNETKNKIDSMPDSSGQSYNEAIKLIHEVGDLYGHGKFIEALNVYNKITNKRMLSETTTTKSYLEDSSKIESEVQEVQRLYNNGQYIQAKKKAKALLDSKVLTNKEDLIVYTIWKNQVDKAPYDPSEHNQHTDFTYNMALSKLKKFIKNSDEYTYTYRRCTNSAGVKTYYIQVGAEKQNLLDTGVYAIDSNGEITKIVII